MGLKDWLAGKVAGPQSYGDVMGRHAREHGSTLANIVFLSHGTRPNAGPAEIFNTTTEMQAAGYKPRYSEITEIGEAQKVLGSLNKEEQVLLMSLQVAMISFAYLVNSNAARRYMRAENSSKFRYGLRRSLLKSMVDCGLFEEIGTAEGEILSYINSIDSAGITDVLNMDRPASGDVLEHFILRAVAGSGEKLCYGFVRTGFDFGAVPLAEETLKSIAGATLNYKW